jgi:beta-aspartyl-peptidase (threonine type)
MPATPTPADELQTRLRFYRFGCIANLLLMAVLAVSLSFVLPVVARVFGLNTPASDETAIRAVLDSQVAAWNQGDLNGFMEGYWRDEQLTFISGDNITHGWEATRDRYQKNYFTPGRDGKLNERGELSFAELQVEGMSPTGAIVRGRYILKLTDKTATGRFTLTFRRLTAGWRITSDHTSRECPQEKKDKEDDKK